MNRVTTFFSFLSRTSLFSLSFLIIFFAPLQFHKSQARNTENADAGSESSAKATAIARQNYVSYAKSIYSEAGLEADGLSYNVFEEALTGFYNLKQESKLSDKDILTVIDFEQSSLKKRMFIIDLKNKKLLFNSVVAHGRNSGNLYAKQFSNKPESNMSSLGFYVTGETYSGKHGLSLRLDGMDAGFNDNARNRAIVMHSADYADPTFAEQVGRLGRSLGCPSIPVEGHEQIINTLAEGTVIFIHYPNSRYEKSCKYLNTDAAVQYVSATASL